MSGVRGRRRGGRRCCGDAARAGSAVAEAGAFGGGPGAEEPVHVDGVGDQTHDEGAGPDDDHGGDADDGVEEPLELHADEGVPVVVAVHHHRVPGLDVPGEGGDEHVGPVAQQVVDGGAQCAEAGLELAVDVFLVAPLLGQLDDLRRGVGGGGVGGEVEEVADLLDESLFALDAADVLAYHHDAVVTCAFAGAVGELGDVFVVEAQVEVSALVDDFLFAVVAPGPGGAGLVLVRRRALQPVPRRRVQGFGSGAQGGDVVRAQHEVDLFGPSVEVGGQGEVGVPAQAHPFRVGAHEGDRLVDPGRG